jgi:hypothetical protein
MDGIQLPFILMQQGDQLKRRWTRQHCGENVSAVMIEMFSTEP